MHVSLKLFLSLMLLVSAAAAAQGFPPPQVISATVDAREMSPSVEVPGTVVSRYDSRLASELAARLEWIAEIGEEVSQGDVVARLESAIFDLQLKEAENRVRREEARVEFLKAEERRLKDLSTRNLSARNQLEQTVSNLGVAESELEIARAQLGLAKVAQNVTRILAPFDGIVTERFRNVGERLNVADPVVRLVDPNALEVVARAPLNTVNYVSRGDALLVENDYRNATASVRTKVPFGNPQSHMFEVRLDVDPTQWTVGESVRVSMPTAAVKRVLAVPRDALVLRREGLFVFRIDSEDVAQRVGVSTGLGDGDYIEVFGELSEGDRVVVRGAERLQPGTKVVDSRGGSASAALQ